ncbi:MAG: class I SAM-dependent methyltransferase [Proteobacteria bacterium]|nr:class I SAM-dependent methyltransferase [Pseudomonadota bacterium]
MAVRGVEAEVYDDDYYAHVRYRDLAGRRAYADHLAGFFRRAVEAPPCPARGGRLLDVGCATGDFVAWARDQGWRAEGIDPSRAAVLIGQQRGLPLRMASADSLAGLRETYDVITMWDVLEHLPRPQRALDLARRALAPGGTFILKTVSSRSLVELSARCLYHLSAGVLEGPLQRIYVPGHLYYFTSETLRRLLFNSGWRVVIEAQDDTPAPALFPPGVVRGLLRLMSLVQQFAGRRFELMVACRKL